MPLYEYRCSGCGHQQEFLQKWSDEPVTVCTSCGKPTFQKMLTAAGFQLKGSGWYATDFKNGGSKPAAKSDAKGESKADAGESKADAGESKAGAKSESKSDAKSDGKADGGTTASKASGSGGSAACS
jgi:putative FmdB family regulatory protein